MRIASGERRRLQVKKANARLQTDYENFCCVFCWRAFYKRLDSVEKSMLPLLLAPSARQASDRRLCWPPLVAKTANLRACRRRRLDGSRTLW